MESAGHIDTRRPIRHTGSVTLFRFRRARWLAAVTAVGVVVLVVGTCHRREPEELPKDSASARSAKTKPTTSDDIAAWSKRFTIQRPPPDELRADPAQQSGTLENGIRYLVVEHPASAGEVSLRLMVLAGSMHEGPGEEGFAHFIEHLAFQDAGGGHAFEIFERLGLASGADTNAHTSLDHTLYRLDLPSADDASLETALTFLSRTAGALTFSDATVDDERRVILRELDERPETSLFCRKAAALLPGVAVLKHPPGGTPASIGAASRVALEEFWCRHYVPSRMVLVAVGDLKAEPMIERLRRHFAEIPSRPASVEPDPGDPMAGVASPVALDADEAKTQVSITLAAPQPIDREPDSLAKRRDELVQAVAMQMLETRIAREFDRRDIAGSPAEGAAVEVVPGLGWLQVSTTASRRDSLWILESLLVAWRRALTHEFHPTEFAEARGRVRQGLRRDLASRLIDGTADLATRLADAARTGRLVELPEDELNRSQADLATVTRQECEAFLNARWPTPPRVLLGGPVDPSVESQAAAIVAKVMSESVPAAPHGAEAATWTPEPPGPPGRVIRRRLEESRGFLEAELANHVVVRLAPIPSLGGYVRVQVDLGRGRQSLPQEIPAIATAASLLCRWYPMDGWDHLKLNAALADADVSRQFWVDANSLRWTGETDRSQLRRQLDLLAALVHRPGLATLSHVWKPGAHERAWEEMVQNTYPVSMRERWRQQTGRDPRYETYPEGLMETDSTQVADWLLPLLAGERLCVSLAGDFEPEAALAVVAATFGALPERPPWDELSPFPPPPLTAAEVTRLPLEMPGATASVTLSFPLGPAGDAAEMLRRILLEETLQLRVREVMREQRGDSYAPVVLRSLPVDHGPEWLVIRVNCAAGQAEETSEALRALVREFREQSWTRDEFRRALRPMSHVIASQARSPSLVLSNLQRPARMPAPAQLDPAALAAMENAVRELARRTLDLESAVELRVDK